MIESNHNAASAAAGSISMKKLPAIPTSRQDATMAVVYNPPSSAPPSATPLSSSASSCSSSTASNKKKRRHRPIGVVCVGGTSAASGTDYFEWKTKRWWSLPAPGASTTIEAGSASATIDDTIYLVCGSDQKQALQSFHFPSKRWGAVEDVPSASSYRSYPAATVGKKTMTSASGGTGDDAQSSSTSTSATVPFLWICGGRNENWEELASCEYYVPSTKEWTILDSAMSVPRFAATAVSVSNQSKIMVIGGYHNMEWLTSIEMYHIPSETWSSSLSSSIHSMPPLPAALTFPQATAVEMADGTSCIVCIGGLYVDDTDSDEDDDDDSNTNILDGDDDHTTPTTSISAKQGQSNSGSGSGSTCFVYMESYNAWRTVPIDYNFEGARISSIGDTIVIVGGKSNDTTIEETNQNVYSFKLSNVLATINNENGNSNDIADNHDVPHHVTTTTTAPPNKKSSTITQQTASTTETSSTISSSQLARKKEKRHPRPRPTKHQQQQQQRNHDAIVAARSPTLSPKRNNKKLSKQRSNRSARSPVPPTSAKSNSKQSKKGSLKERLQHVDSIPPPEVLSSIFVPSAFPAYDHDLSIASSSGTTSSSNNNNTNDEFDNDQQTESDSIFHQSITSFDSFGNTNGHHSMPKETQFPTKNVTNYPMRDSKGSEVFYTGTVTITKPIKPYGTGIMNWIQSKNIYDGEFDMDGNRDGYGIMKYYSTAGGYDVYKGSFQNDKKHGKGIYTCANGRIYEGNYKNGKPNDPNGTLTMVDGSIYMGTFKNGKRTGRGILHLSNGRGRFQGDFQNGKYHGYGTMQFGSSTSETQQEYTGYWKDGKAHGRGRLINSRTNATVYEGMWFQDQPDKDGSKTAAAVAATAAESDA